jgi:hypothetical protein
MSQSTSSTAAHSSSSTCLKAHVAPQLLKAHRAQHLNACLSSKAAKLKSVYQSSSIKYFYRGCKAKYIYIIYIHTYMHIHACMHTYIHTFVCMYDIYDICIYHFYRDCQAEHGHTQMSFRLAALISLD